MPALPEEYEPDGAGEGARLDEREILLMLEDDHLEGRRFTTVELENVRARGWPLVTRGSVMPVRALYITSVSACARKRRTTRVNALQENKSSCMVLPSTCIDER